MSQFITIAESIVAVLIIGLVLLQERDMNGSSLMGGGGGEGLYHERRGLEKILFFVTIALVFIFGGIALSHLVFTAA